MASAPILFPNEVAAPAHNSPEGVLNNEEGFAVCVCSVFLMRDVRR
jgi:hypothetical protein